MSYPADRSIRSSRLRKFSYSSVFDFQHFRVPESLKRLSTPAEEILEPRIFFAARLRARYSKYGLWEPVFQRKKEIGHCPGLHWWHSRGTQAAFARAAEEATVLLIPLASEDVSG